jgi:hypothetical protein
MHGPILAAAVSKNILCFATYCLVRVSAWVMSSVSDSGIERAQNKPVAISGQNLHLFQMDWRMDKISRRNANCGNKRLFGLTYH